MDKVLKNFILCYYFPLSALDGLLSMLGYTNFNKLSLILLLSNLWVAISIFLNRNRGFLNYFVLFFILFYIFYGFTCQLPTELFAFGVKYQLIWMLAFITGQDYQIAPKKVVEKGIIALVVVGIIGLLWFVSPPGWYMQWKLEGVKSASSIYVLEMSRLSAFWKYPYWVSYGAAICSYYIIIRIFQNENKYNKISVYLVLCLLFVIIFCCQQRAPLFFMISAYVVLFTLSMLKGRVSVFKYGIIILFFLIIVGTLFMSNSIPVYVLDYAVERLTDGLNTNEGNIISRRYEMFASVSKSELIMGEGIGKYSHAANQLGLPSIPDNQWLCIFHEMGFLGALFYASFFIYIFYIAIQNYRDNLFELGIILFYFVSMIGANTLSVEEEHTFIFWLCCGSVYRKKMMCCGFIYKKGLIKLSKKYAKN